MHSVESLSVWYGLIADERGILPTRCRIHERDADATSITDFNSGYTPRNAWQSELPAACTFPVDFLRNPIRPDIRVDIPEHETAEFPPR